MRAAAAVATDGTQTAVSVAAGRRVQLAGRRASADDQQQQQRKRDRADRELHRRRARVAGAVLRAPAAMSTVAIPEAAGA